MKISHSIIVLITIIFVTGSMITVGMDVKSTTKDVSTNVVEAKQKYNEQKEMDTASNIEYELGLEKNKMNKQKAVYKLKSLNQQNTRSTN